MWSAIAMAAILMAFQVIHVHGKYVYSTQALEKEREIVKEETALRKEIEAVCCYAVQGCIQSYNYIYRQPRRLRKPHAHVYIYIRAAATA